MKRIFLILSLLFLLFSCKDDTMSFIKKFGENYKLDSRFFGYWQDDTDLELLGTVQCFREDGSFLYYSYDNKTKSYTTHSIRVTGESTRIWGYLEEDNMLAILQRGVLDLDMPWNIKGTISTTKYSNINFENDNRFTAEYVFKDKVYIENFRKVTDKDMLDKLDNAKEIK